MANGTLSIGNDAGGDSSSHYIIPFELAGGESVARIGGKCAGLAALVNANAPVSPGFAVTTDAFAEMMSVEGLGKEIESILARLDVSDIRNEADVSHAIGAAILQRPMPSRIADSIRSAYGRLCTDTEKEVAVAVRSSGTGEDLPDASFAGQGNTYLSIVGAEAVVDNVKNCWASLYTARAISYRAQCGMGQRDVQMAVAIQVMVDARSAGVAMTLDPGNGDRSKIVVESTWGLGETLVSGEVTPDHFLIDKVMLIPVERRIAVKDHELIIDPATRTAVHRPVIEERRNWPSISDDELRTIALAAKTIERHFGCPQDIEWAIDEKRVESKGVVILQSRPETVWSKKRAAKAQNNKYVSGTRGVLDTLIAPLLAKNKQEKAN
jgi:pyruvate,water dikinase